jgi:DNA-binding NarL/FixJ family response regulator
MEQRATKAASTIRVLIADTSQIHAQLLACALRSDPSLEPVAAVSDFDEVISEAVKRNADILVINCAVDEQAPRTFEVLHEIRKSQLPIRAIVLLESAKADLIVQSFRAGAKGLFSLHEPVDVLPECIRRVHEGQIWADRTQTTIAIEALESGLIFGRGKTKGIKSLSQREVQVVQAVAEGLTNCEIGERLGISQHTVKNHLFRVFDKLGVSNRIELLFMTLGRSRFEDI